MLTISKQLPHYSRGLSNYKCTYLSSEFSEFVPYSGFDLKTVNSNINNSNSSRNQWYSNCRSVHVPLITHYICRSKLTRSFNQIDNCNFYCWAKLTVSVIIENSPEFCCNKIESLRFQSHDNIPDTLPQNPGR